VTLSIQAGNYQANQPCLQTVANTGIAIAYIVAIP